MKLLTIRLHGGAGKPAENGGDGIDEDDLGQHRSQKRGEVEVAVAGQDARSRSGFRTGSVIFTMP